MWLFVLVYLFLKYSWFIMLSLFLVYNKVIQICIYIHIHIYTLFHILYHYGLLQDIGYSSLYYTARLCCLYILYPVVCICWPLTPNIPSSGGFPSGLDGNESACNTGDPGWFLGWEDPLEKGRATYSTILAWRIFTDRGPLQSWGRKELDMNEWLTHPLTLW